MNGVLCQFSYGRQLITILKGSNHDFKYTEKIQQPRKWGENESIGLQYWNTWVRQATEMPMYCRFWVFSKSFCEKWGKDDIQISPKNSLNTRQNFFKQE